MRNTRLTRSGIASTTASSRWPVKSTAGTRSATISRKTSCSSPVAYLSGDRAEVGLINFVDQGLSEMTKMALTWTPSHHQKMVVVDHESHDTAVGFVMGHNMLDPYWDTPEHSAVRMGARSGRNGKTPWHDYSTRVTGPIVGDLFRNFAQAWKRETQQSLPLPAFETYPVRGDSTAVCQLLRTQPQHGRTDIMKAYLQACSNAAQYIHIENQYFRWPPLAEKIKESAARMGQWGRKPEEHGALHLFVITNSSDDGVGKGTVNTYRMLDALGRADRIPEVARQQRVEAVDKGIKATEQAMAPYVAQRDEADAIAGQLQGAGGTSQAITARYERINERLGPLEQRKAALERQKVELARPDAIKPEEVEGLKIHVATLVAPDTAAGQPWQEVYVHAKMMLVDDAFMMLGSANINTRSMQVDSELNIAHHRPEITKPLREQQWERYTAGRVTAGMPMSAAFKKWGDVMSQNAKARKASDKPIAQLSEFMRTSPKIENKD